MAQPSEMKQQLKVRYITPEDGKKFVELVNSTPNNLYDPKVLEYPTLRILCSYNGQPVAYLPLQQAIVLESLAVEQGQSALDTAQAFRDLVKGAELHASSLMIKELYFVCKDEAVITVARGHGFDVLGDKQEDGSVKPWPTLRMRL